MHLSIYRVQVLTHLDAQWKRNSIIRMRHIRNRRGLACTVLDVQVQDQGELLGMLEDFCGLGLRLVGVRLIQPIDQADTASVVDDASKSSKSCAPA